MAALYGGNGRVVLFHHSTIILPSSSAPLTPALPTPHSRGGPAAPCACAGGGPRRGGDPAVGSPPSPPHSHTAGGGGASGAALPARALRGRCGRCAPAAVPGPPSPPLPATASCNAATTPQAVCRGDRGPEVALRRRAVLPEAEGPVGPPAGRSHRPVGPRPEGRQEREAPVVRPAGRWSLRISTCPS